MIWIKAVEGKISKYELTEMDNFKYVTIYILS